MSFHEPPPNTTTPQPAAGGGINTVTSFWAGFALILTGLLVFGSTSIISSVASLIAARAEKEDLQKRREGEGGQAQIAANFQLHTAMAQTAFEAKVEGKLEKYEKEVRGLEERLRLTEQRLATKDEQLAELKRRFQKFD